MRRSRPFKARKSTVKPYESFTKYNPAASDVDSESELTPLKLLGLRDDETSFLSILETPAQLAPSSLSYLDWPPLLDSYSHRCTANALIISGTSRSQRLATSLIVSALMGLT
jgi:hypothetical protein